MREGVGAKLSFRVCTRLCNLDRCRQTPRTGGQSGHLLCEEAF